MSAIERMLERAIQDWEMRAMQFRTVSHLWPRDSLRYREAWAAVQASADTVADFLASADQVEEEPA